MASIIRSRNEDRVIALASDARYRLGARCLSWKNITFIDNTAIILTSEIARALRVACCLQAGRYCWHQVGSSYQSTYTIWWFGGSVITATKRPCRLGKMPAADDDLHQTQCAKVGVGRIYIRTCSGCIYHPLLVHLLQRISRIIAAQMSVRFSTSSVMPVISRVWHQSLAIHA